MNTDLTQELFIAYHIVRGKPVMKKVSTYMFGIDLKNTYWISIKDQDNVTTDFLKYRFKTMVRKYV